MTRKHYQAIAAVFADTLPLYNHSQESQRAINEIVGRIADVFAADNSRFDRAKFLAACGFPD